MEEIQLALQFFSTIFTFVSMISILILVLHTLRHDKETDESTKDHNKKIIGYLLTIIKNKEDL